MGTCSHLPALELGLPPIPQILGFSQPLQSLFYFSLNPPFFPALQTPGFQHSAELVVSIFLVKEKLRGYKEISQLSTLPFLCTDRFPGIIPLSWAKSCPALSAGSSPRAAELGLVLAVFALNLQEIKLMRIRPFLAQDSP